jgi:GMP synthase (glutamine-hydrolysing)
VSGGALLLVRCGTTKEAIRAEHGDFAAWIRRTAGWTAAEAPECAPYLGEALPEPAGLAGAVLTGSPAMVTDDEAWMRSTAGWLRGAVAAGLPLFGICFGHQLLAAALGGRVADHPAGMELGTVEVEAAAPAGEDALFGGMPARYAVQATHAQGVVALPPGAVVLAGNAHEPHHAVRFAPRCWGVQFHPEADAAVMRGYVAAYSADAAAGRKRIGLLGEPVRETPEANALLARFAALARG